MERAGAEYKYWAFISYTHSDQRWARWLHRSLETFSIPRGTVAPPGLSASKTIAPVFRDRDELASSANLSEQLRQALEASRHLIVICSRAVAKSRWVEEEVAVFRRLGRSERILCLIVDDADEAPGDRPGGACVPPWLLEPVPLGADPRHEADGKRNALLKIAAAVLEVSFDTLRRRHDVRRRQVMTLTVAASLFGCALFAGITLWALAQRSLANEEKSRALWATHQRTATLAASYFVQASSASKSSERLAYLARSLRLNPNRQGAIAATALALATGTVPQSFEPLPREKDAGEDAAKLGPDDNEGNEGNEEQTETDEGDPFDPANVSPALRTALSLDKDDRIDPNLPREHPLQETGRKILIQLRAFIGGNLEASALDSLYYQRLWRMAYEAVTSPDERWIWLHEADMGNSSQIPRLDIQIDTRTQQPIASYDFRLSAGPPSFTPDSRFVIAYPHVMDVATQAQVVDLHELAPNAMDHAYESNPPAVVTFEPGWRVSWRLPTLPMRTHDVVGEFQLVRDHLLVEREPTGGPRLAHIYDLRSQSLVARSPALPDQLEARLSYGATTMLIANQTDDDEDSRAKAPASIYAVDLKTQKRLRAATEISRPYFEFGDGALIAQKGNGLICLDMRTGKDRILPAFSSDDVLISEDRRRAMVSGRAMSEGLFYPITADVTASDADASSSGTVKLAGASTQAANDDVLVFDADSPESCEPALILQDVGLARFAPNRAIYALDAGGAITRYERDGTKRVLAQTTADPLFPWSKEEQAAPDPLYGDAVTPEESRLNRDWGGFAVSDDGNFAIIIRPSYAEVFHVGSDAVQNTPTRIELRPDFLRRLTTDVIGNIWKVAFALGDRSGQLLVAYRNRQGMLVPYLQEQYLDVFELSTSRLLQTFRERRGAAPVLTSKRIPAPGGFLMSEEGEIFDSLGVAVATFSHPQRGPTEDDPLEGSSRRILFDGRHFVSARDSGDVYVWDMPPIPPHAPAWLAELTEAMAGVAINEEGLLREISVPERKATLDRIRAQIRGMQPPSLEEWVERVVF